MAQNEVLARKNEILRRKISMMILQENKDGLSDQESSLMRHLIREYHHNSYHLNTTLSN